MTDNIQTAWMWQDEITGGTQGAVVDLERGVIHWHDEPGCACTVSDVEQTIESFLAKGPHIIYPPEAIQDEMRRALRDVIQE